MDQFMDDDANQNGSHEKERPIKTDLHHLPNRRPTLQESVQSHQRQDRDNRQLETDPIGQCHID